MRLDVATGKAQEIALREEAFVRLVRNATEEEIKSLSSARPIDQSGRVKVEAQLKPPARLRSDEYPAARDAAIKSGAIVKAGCNDSNQLGESLRGCMAGIEANVLTRFREGADWAEAHKPSRSYECSLDDPVANMGCFLHFRKYPGDVFPVLPETTTAECQLEAKTRADIGFKYTEASWPEGSLQPRVKSSRRRDPKLRHLRRSAFERREGDASTWARRRTVAVLTETLTPRAYRADPGRLGEAVNPI